MRATRLCSVVAVLMTGVALAAAKTYSIAAERIDPKQVYFGSAQGFDKPGSVDFTALVRSTPEFAEMREKDVERGSARYWILVSQATDHAAKAIAAVGRESEYDIIVAAGYLETMEPPIPTEDITGLVLARLDPEYRPAKPASAPGSGPSVRDAGKDASKAGGAAGKAGKSAAADKSARAGDEARPVRTARR